MPPASDHDRDTTPEQRVVRHLREFLRNEPLARCVMRHGRWNSATVMRGYVEEGSIWNDNAAAKLGL